MLPKLFSPGAVRASVVSCLGSGAFALPASFMRSMVKVTFPPSGQPPTDTALAALSVAVPSTFAFVHDVVAAV